MTRNQRLVLMLPVLGVAAWLAVFADKTPVENQAGMSSVAPTTSQSAGVDEADAALEDVASSSTEATGVVRLRDRKYLIALQNEPLVNLFGAPNQSASGEQQAEAAPPPPPPPPSQPFVYIGRMRAQNSWVVFLEREGQMHVAKPKDLLDGFRVDAVDEQEIRLTQLSDQYKFVITVGDEKKDANHD